MKIQQTLNATVVLVAACFLAACGNGTPSAGTQAQPPAASSSVGGQGVGTAPQAYTPGAVGGAFTQCNIESFDKGAFPAGAADVSPASMHRIDGWVALPNASKPAYFLRMDDKLQGHFYEFPVVLSVKRADVMAAEGNAGLPLMSGFEQSISPHALPSGHYHVYLAAVDGDVTRLCDNGRTLEVK